MIIYFYDPCGRSARYTVVGEIGRHHGIRSYDGMLANSNIAYNNHIYSQPAIVTDTNFSE